MGREIARKSARQAPRDTLSGPRNACAWRSPRPLTVTTAYVRLGLSYQARNPAAQWTQAGFPPVIAGSGCHIGCVLTRCVITDRTFSHPKMQLAQDGSLLAKLSGLSGFFGTIPWIFGTIPDKEETRPWGLAALHRR